MLTVILSLLLSLLWSSPASAGDPINHEQMLQLQMVYAAKRDNPWGVRLGTSYLYSLGDHCSYRETDCRTDRGLAQSLWPLLGPAAGIEWRGGKRFAVELSAEAGPASLDMHQTGFLSYWQVMVAPGFRWTVEEGPMLALRGYLSKSLSTRFFTPDAQSYRLNGTEGLDLRVDLATAWGGHRLSPSGWAAPTVMAGLQTMTMAADLE
ncbi:MAG: hypothetical protein GXP62_11550 [Oligoflexia bacterium]|nr:hypothetical protein [Oligoflexia bacterium]